MRQWLGFVALGLFALTIPLANWMIGNVGQCAPDGPCVVPVGFGLAAPSGVLVVGAALVLRDVVHERLGIMWAVAAITVGVALSFVLAPPILALASATAFALAEGADLAVYAPLRKRAPVAAVLLSGTVGAAIDSAIFLWLAFGSLAFVEGQIVGKLWMSLAAAAILFAVRRCWLGHRWVYDGEDLPYIGVVGRCERCDRHQHVGNPML